RGSPRLRRGEVVNDAVAASRGVRGSSYTLLTPANRYASRLPNLERAHLYKLVTPRLAPAAEAAPRPPSARPSKGWGRRGCHRLASARTSSRWKRAAAPASR